MATQGPEDVAARRVSLRRARSGGSSAGFSSGISSSSESLRDSEYEDEDLNARVRNAAVPPVSGDPADRENPRQRMAEVAMAGSQSYAKEYRLNLLHKLLMRGVSLDLISQQLGVSISTIEKDRIALKARLRESARSLDINEMVGAQNALYDDITAASLRLASSSTVPVPMKLASMRTALAANADRTRFLTSAGVFDVLAYRRAENGADLSDIQVLMQKTDDMLANLSAMDDEPKPQTIVRRKPKPGAFKAMSFDDATASSGDQEVQEL